MLLSLGKKSTTGTQKNSTFPTGIPTDKSSTSNPLNPLPNPSSTLNPSTSLIDISTIVPVEAEDFRLQYFPKQNKIYVERKTVQAEQKFFEWANQNNYPQLIDNPDLVSIVNKGQGPTDFNPMIEFLNIFMNMGQGEALSPSPFSSPSSPPLPPNSLTPSNISKPSSYIYYAQCDGPYANVPMDTGCNLCQTGCGPTTAAMIASSYLGYQYNPKTIVDLYRSKGYLLSCSGTRYSDAKSLLQSLGLRTTDFLVFDLETADQVVSDMKKYLSSGWTIFALANFKDEGPGHFFWITEIDSKNNIWAYDAYYGRFEAPPINENSRYPFPKYRIAFGVKK